MGTQDLEMYFIFLTEEQIIYQYIFLLFACSVITD